MSRTNQLAKSLTVAYAYQFVVLTVGLLLVPLLLSRLGSATYGRWLVVGQVLGVLSLLDLGVTALLSREVAAASGGPEPDRALPQLLRRVTWLVWYQTPVVVLASAGAWVYVTAGRPELRLPLGLILAAFVCFFPARIFAAVLNGMQDFVYSTGTQAAAWAVTTVVSVGLVLGGVGLTALAVGWVAGQTVAAVAAYRRVRTRFAATRAWSGRPGWPALRSLIAPSLWGSVYQLAAVLTLGSDLILVAWAMGTEAVVGYSCTAKLATIAALPLAAVVTSSLPALSQLRATGDQARYWRAARGTGQLLLLVSGAAAVAITAANAGFVRQWVGAAQFGGPTVSVLCVLVMVARHYTLTLTGPAYTLGRERRLAGMALVEGVVSVAATCAWATWFGLAGVPLGPLTALALVSVPVALTAIADGAGVSRWQVVGWSGSWFVRFAAVFVPVVAATYLLPVGEPWVAAALTTGGLASYAAVTLPLLSREPLDVYKATILGAVRRRLRLSPRA
ncbi:MAG TPA: oligosaccharide flippase family protein [Gemmataceae bacterium]|nr:oligosaccharide flippase family protein [Gemmataceae bacterium]